METSENRPSGPYDMSHIFPLHKTILQYYHFILEEKNYMFEGMLIKIVIWSFEYFHLYM
jgi:hypothetical protein